MFTRMVIVLDILLADEAGFCFGVKRAVEKALKAAEAATADSPVYTLGPIIHNPQVVSKLEEMGVMVANSLSDIEKGTVIIRSHGVPPKIIDEAQRKGLKVIDTTCPFVKKAQKYAKRLIDEGYQTIIYGDREHPEVEGILGAADGNAIIVSNLEELGKIELKSKIGFVAQTTSSPLSYKELIASVIEDVKILKVYNTICNTTENHQQSAVALAEKVDVMFVIGGLNSANTKGLVDICRRTRTPTYHIETAADIDKQWLKDKKKIGITAGASTPEWLIKEVIEVMSEEKKDLQIEEIIEEEGVNNEAEDTVIEEVEAAVEDNEENTADDTEENADETIKTVEETGDNEIKLDEPEDVDTIKNEQIDYSNNEIADLKKGQIVTGTVSQIEADGVYVDVNYKTDGFIPLRELSHKNITDPAEVVELNEEIDVVILTLEDDEGNMILSKKRADYEKAWETIMDAYENNKVIEAEVTKVVKGGLVVDVGLRGFIPASHVAIGYVENLDEYLGKTLRLKAIEVERDKNNVVLSAKEVLEEEKAELKKKTLEKLEEGQVIKGVITKLVDFGAFVDLGGIEGLLHISEMSWGRIDHPTDIFEEGQEIEVKVLGFNKEEERISLGYKQLLPDPWQQFLDKHYVGEIVTGTVTKLVDFGAFVEIEKGVEGLIHISQLSYRHVKTADEVVSVGEEVTVKIININEEQKRVGLSIKELEEKPVPRTGKKAKVHESKAEEEQATGGVTIREMVGDLDLGSEE